MKKINNFEIVSSKLYKHKVFIKFSFSSSKLYNETKGNSFEISYLTLSKKYSNFVLVFSSFSLLFFLFFLFFVKKPNFSIVSLINSLKISVIWSPICKFSSLKGPSNKLYKALSIFCFVTKIEL